MFVANNFAITKRGENFYVGFDNTTYKIEPANTDYSDWTVVYARLRSLSANGSERAEWVKNNILDVDPSNNLITRLVTPDTEGSATPITDVRTPREKMVSALEKLINFFKEFEFEPNFRFVNTLSYKVKESAQSARDYICNYFSLVDNSYKTEICSKIKSPEFTDILECFAENATPSAPINQRFAVYYGSAGTGKTTLAMKESDGRCIVCNASMLPSDIMEDFVFDASGKPTFQKSKLWNCMEKGEPIVLDEINLLPFDSLRFLQGILDGKKEFDWKGHKVTIADGFKVIGTMNLTIGGMVYGLPEPLIDRCGDMKKFALTAEQLVGAVL